MVLPRSYTPQIMGILVRAQLVAAKAGRDGGYRLLRQPSEISLLEVVEAGEGSLKAHGCTLRGGPCRWADVCALHETWGAASKAFRLTLEKTSLEDISQIDSAIDTGEYPIPPDHHRHNDAAVV